MAEDRFEDNAEKTTVGQTGCAKYQALKHGSALTDKEQRRIQSNTAFFWPHELADHSERGKKSNQIIHIHNKINYMGHFLFFIGAHTSLEYIDITLLLAPSSAQDGGKGGPNLY